MKLPQVFEHPFSIFDSFQGDDTFFNHLMRLPRTQDDNGNIAFQPPCDITESESAFSLKVDFPGIAKDDINIHIKDGVLQIDAESSSEEEEKEGDRVLRSERRYGKYIRRFNLGMNASQDDVKASFDNGVLTLMIPKKEQVTEESMKIDID